MRRTRRPQKQHDCHLYLHATTGALSFRYVGPSAASGSFLRIGEADAVLEVTTSSGLYTESVRVASHRHALRVLIDFLQRNSLLRALQDVKIVVHRISHGGTQFAHTSILTRDSLHKLDAIAHLSPEVPAATGTLHAALLMLSNATHIGVFDTAPYVSLPREAQEYALSPHLRQQFHLRRWGAQGILHRALHDAGVALQRRKPRRVITVVIDDEVSVSAWVDARIVDTTTGFTAAEGLPGLHRVGSLDPRIPLHLAHHLHLSPAQTDQLLNQQSGLAAMAGCSSYEELERAARKRALPAVDALLLLSHRLAQAIAGMLPSTDGLELLLFTGSGASWLLLEESCRRLGSLGIRLGKGKRAGVVSAPSSRVRVALLPIDEEQAALDEALSRYHLHKHLKTA